MHFIPEHLRGIACFITAMLFFSWMNVLIRGMSGDMHALQMVFIRNVFSFVFLLPLIIKHGIKATKTSHTKLHLWRAFIGLIAMEAWFYSLIQLPVNTATAISFTAPLFGTIFAVLFLGEHIGIRRILALCVGFSGVLVIANPFNGASWHPIMLVALFSAAMIAAAGVIVKRLTDTEPGWRIVFYMTIFMSLMSLPPALAVWQTPTNDMLFTLCIIGLLSTLAQLCLTAGFSRSPMVLLMPFDFTRLIFTASLAWILLAEPITTSTISGSLIIIASTVFIVWCDSNNRRNES